MARAIVCLTALVALAALQSGCELHDPPVSTVVGESREELRYWFCTKGRRGQNLVIVTPHVTRYASGRSVRHETVKIKSVVKECW